MSENAGNSVKNDKFMSLFWDLASLDDQVRQSAGSNLIFFINDRVKSGDTVDIKYALKRLIRGLGSSRDAARQGFASSLCELLKFPEISSKEVFDAIDEHFKVTGSMKGSEERDLLFGKLFCYSSIIRSKRMNESDDFSKVVFNGLLDLHKKRGWLREVVTEVIFSFLHFSGDYLTAEMLTQLEPLVGDTLEEVEPWQLMLIIGLQTLAEKNSSFRKLYEISELSSNQFTFQSLDELVPSLQSSTAGFPKIHRLWDYLLSFIFPMDEERQLPTARLETLTEEQESRLSTLSVFLDKNFYPLSKEKRAFALCISAKMTARCPADCIPIALSETAVRCIVSSRVNKKHSLFPLAGQIVSDLLSSTGKSSASRLGLASALVQFGGANFDSITGTGAVSKLLIDLDSEAVMTHVRFLCGVIGSLPRHEEIILGTEDEEIANEDAASIHSTKVIAALEALVALGKSPRPDVHLLRAVALTVLTRLACGAEGRLSVENDSKTGEKKKKSTKKPKKIESVSCAVDNLFSENNEFKELETICLSCLSLVEENNKIVPLEVAKFAGTRLKGLLAENATISLFPTKPNLETKADLGVYHKNKKRKKDEVEKDEKESLKMSKQPTGLHFVWKILSRLTHSEVKFLKSISFNPNEENEVNEEFNENLKELIKSVDKAIDVGLKLLESVEVGEGGSGRLRGFVEAIVSFEVQTTVKLLVFDEEGEQDCEMEQAIAEAIPHLFLKLCPWCPSTTSPTLPTTTKTKSKSTNEEEENEIDEPEGSVLVMQLLEFSLEQLAAPVETAGRGLRESVRKVWQHLTPLLLEQLEGEGKDGGPFGEKYELIEEMLEVVLEAVLGPTVEDEEEEEEEDEIENENEEEDESENENKEEDESENEVEEESEDEKEEEQQQKEKMKKKKTKNAKKDETDKPLTKPTKLTKTLPSTTTPADETQDDDDDILLDESDGLALLVSDWQDDADDDEPTFGVDEMRAQDQALGELVQMRKNSRKEGLLRARRKELLLRTRAIDLLEAMLHRLEDGSLVVPLFLPLLKGLVKEMTGAGEGAFKGLAESGAFSQRLQVFIDQKLCKKKFRLVWMEAEEDNFTPELRDLLDFLTKIITTNANVSLRQLAQRVFFSISRGICSPITASNEGNSSDSLQNPFDKNEYLDILMDSFGFMLENYCEKKNSKVNIKLFDEFVLQRHSDVFIAYQWTNCLKLMSDLKASSYVKGEICRLIGTLIKRQNLSGFSKSIMESEENWVLLILCSKGFIESLNEKSEKKVKDGKNVNAKNIKPILQFSHDVVEFSKKVCKNEKEMTKSSKSRQKLVKNISKQFNEVLASLNNVEEICTNKNLGPVVIKLFNQLKVDINDFNTEKEDEVNGKAINEQLIGEKRNLADEKVEKNETPKKKVKSDKKKSKGK